MTDRTPLQILDALTDHGFAPVDPHRIIAALREAGYAVVPVEPDHTDILAAIRVLEDHDMLEEAEELARRAGVTHGELKQTGKEGVDGDR